MNGKSPVVPRRTMLLGGAGLAGATAAGGTLWTLFSRQPPGNGRVLATAPAVAQREQARHAAGTGRTVSATLTVRPAEVDLGGRVVSTWAYDGRVPGSTIRCRAGDRLDVELVNELAEPTTVHWHGLRLRNDMDGVPHLTQQPVRPGARTRYSFIASDPGTYWFHPHVGVQRERGLYAPLIIDDPREAGDYDVEFVAVLDDWIDGVAASPDQVVALLRAAGPHGMHVRYQTSVLAGAIVDRSGSWQYHVPTELASPPPGIEAEPPQARLRSSVDYSFYLINGRMPTDPPTFTARPGQRARIRLINAGGATVFRVALGGHRLRVTHTDGFPVQPVTVDTLQVASGERYDLIVTLADGVFPLVAVAEGKGAQAMAIVRTASGPTPTADAAPGELAGRLLTQHDLHAAAPGADGGSPEVSHPLYLTGDMNSFTWRINAQTYQHANPFDGVTPTPVLEGQRVRLVLVNQTPMYHPMHLHGHTVTVHAIGDSSGTTEQRLPGGVHKDTLMIPPGDASPSISPPTIPASGSCTATTPITCPPAWRRSSPTSTEPSAFQCGRNPRPQH